MSNLICLMVDVPVYNQQDNRAYKVDLLVDADSSNSHNIADYELIASPDAEGRRSKLSKRHMIVISKFVPNGAHYNLADMEINDLCRKNLNMLIQRYKS